MNKFTVQDTARFYEKVAVAGEDDCWLWLGSKVGAGYGTFTFRGKPMYAHRFAYWIATGVWPGELDTCHTCDNPGCVNPAHLWLGTRLQNMQDAVSKGRVARGEKSGPSKLENGEVCQIRTRYATGDIFQRQLAVEFDVSQSDISYIVNRKYWQHI